jgi:16S rRNA (guanine527-N7)-methyltransferase
MNTDAFLAAARTFDVTLTPAQCDAFETYYRELVAWNARVNLTAITKRDEVYVKHFLDSLSVAPFVRAARRVLDIGSGAGFPGVPLKIALPDLNVTLLEATGKKVAFLWHIVTQLGLHDVSIVHARAEDVAHDTNHRAQYDVVVVRAVATLATLCEYALPFLQQGGLFIAQKGVQVDDEVRASARAREVLGGRLREIVQVQLPGFETRHLVIIEKVVATPDAYPRRAGVPERRPLVR